MSEKLSLIIGAIILTVMLFVFPIYYSAQKMDAITQDYVSVRVDQFVEAVRKQGKLTQDMYNDFITELDTTNLMYNIEMEYTHTTVVPRFDTTGAVSGTYSFDETIYEDEILQEVFNNKHGSGENSGVYLMEKGSYFYVRVKNREGTLFSKLSKMFLNTSADVGQIMSFAGGSLRDENY